MQNISRRAVLQAGGSLGLAGLACTDALAAPGASYDGSADVIVVGLGGAGALFEWAAAGRKGGKTTPRG